MDLINRLDTEVLYFVNQFARNSASFDLFVKFVSENPLLKGGLFSVILWFFWYRIEDRKTTRLHILAGLMGCFVTMTLARIMALSLPFRLRPMHNAGLKFMLPIGLEERVLDGMSAFPSDHAALFFALSTSIWFVSKKAGIFSFLYTIVVICLPRLYLGFHYLSDLLGGAILGIFIVVLMNQPLVLTKLTQPLYAVERKYPALFYCTFFLITYQIADLFEGIRSMVRFSIEWIAI